MPRPQRIDPEQARQAIITAAESLYRTVGYTKTTIADIASSLGMSPANIYRFFKSKAEINEAICDRFMLALSDNCRDAVNPEDGTLENISAMMLAFHRYIRRNAIANKGVYDMVMTATDQLWPAIRYHKIRLTGLIENVLKLGMTRGDIQPDDSMRLASLVFAAVVEFLDPRLLVRTMNDCAEMGVQEHMEDDLLGVIALLTRGMAAPKRS